MILLSSIIILLSNAVTFRRDKSLSFNRITIIILLYSGQLSFNCLYVNHLETGIGIYGGLFHITAISQTFVVFITILGILIMQLTSFYPRRIYNIITSVNKPLEFETDPYTPNYLDEQIKIIEYPLIILFILIGAISLMSSSDLTSMFLSLELQSYGLYIFCTLHRNSELATSAGLTYFLLGGLSSCFILLGSGLLYANTGVTYLDGIYILYNLSDSIYLESLFTEHGIMMDNYGMFPQINPRESFNLSLVILSVGYLFKVSSAPFHYWSPDVYDSLPTIVTTFVTIIAKISIFIFILDIVHYANGEKSEFTWTDILLLSSLLSLIVGTVLGLVQSRIKRLLAYSTISHVGFILLALTINSIESIQAFIFYLMQYSLSNLNFFFILISLGYLLFYYNCHHEYNLAEKDNSPLQLISQFSGFFFKNHILSLCLGITLFSFAGIPPLLGFFAKQMILSAALDKGYVFMALIAIVTSVIGAVYYLRIIKVVFFDKDKYLVKPKFRSLLNTNNEWNLEMNQSEFSKAHTVKSENIFLSTSLSLTISSLTLIILLFIIKPQIWLSNASTLALILFNS